MKWRDVMKLIHLSDLHIGKKINEFSMLKDQQYIFEKIIQIIDGQKIECVLIAGDIYDKSIPSKYAVQLFDDFLTRIAFGSKLMCQSKVYFSPAFEGDIKPILLHDEYGEIAIYMLPFIKPAIVKNIYEYADIESYNDAVKIAIEHMDIDKNRRNILVAHQFVTGAETSESEDISVGGIDNVDACVTIVTLKQKQNIMIDTIELIPKRDMCEIKGYYQEVTALNYYQNMNTQNYMHIILKDEQDIADAMAKLRSIYPNIMRLDYDNKRTQNNQIIQTTQNIENKTPLQLLQQFYEIQNNDVMNKQQTMFCSKIMEEIWEEET